MGSRTSGEHPLLINELVAVLNELSSEIKEQITFKFPELSSELELGVWAGEEEGDESKKILLSKAKFTSEVLSETTKQVESTLGVVSKKMQYSNRIRLAGQLAAVIGSSSAIGAVGLGENVVAQISAALALLGSVSGIFTGYFESILGKKSGSINDIYIRLNEYSFEASLIKNNIETHLELGASIKELASLVAAGNELARKMNTDALLVP